MEDEDDDTTRYAVVVNDEEQYSLWEADTPPPAGWRSTGFEGSRQECLDHIEVVWTDMRPRSLREALAAAAAGDAPPGSDALAAVLEDDTPDLVSRLSDGDHRVEVVLRPESTVAALREAVDAGYVLVRFPDTRGGTELGVRVDPAACDLSGLHADGRGEVTLEGTLTLDFEQVRCEATVRCPELHGRGRLRRVAAAG